ncbi:unnamed protein product [Paramecium pentaurelia]|uniref:Calpain catalytic domain-containing protein n=1 Tax=Paramecium pentaurelia TaxID=43138 RepID=A0A8S1X3J9_9CILI|nr:unnamed protein product [Paramecium pentaurelia]
MQYEDRQKYDEEMKNFYLEQKQKFEQKDFYDKSENQMLVLYELKQIEKIKNSYLADYKLKPSQFYNSFPLINAFNIVQSNMRNLKQLFEQREDGLFGVWLWEQGLQYLIIVDDQIPCKLNGNYPQLATITSEYEWPIILEKAIGYILGFGYNSFNVIKNDTIDFYLQMITGSLIYEQEFQSFEELEKIQKDKSNILFVKYYQDSKTIASVITIPDKQQQQKLIKLIAPNQQSIFKQGKQKVDSVCYLNWEEFKQNFQTVHVLIWKDEYRVTAMSLEKPIERKTDIIEHTYFYKFKIEDNSNYWITLWQKEYIIEEGNMIIINNQNEKKHFGLIRMLLFQELKANQYRFIDGNCNFARSIYINPFLEKGEYYILCQIYFNNQKNYSLEQLQKQFNLNLTIKGIKVPLNIYPNNQYEQQQINLIKSLIKDTQSKDNIRSFNQIQQPQILVSTNKIYGFLYFYYENRGSIDIQEQIQFKELGYLIKYDSLLQQKQALVKVKQNYFQILLYTLDPKIILEQENINFQYEYTHTLINDNQIQIVESQRFQEIINDQNTKKIKCEQICIYINQHNQGIIMQYENNSEQHAQIELKFSEFINLCLVNKEDYNVNELSIKFSIQKLTKMQMFFDTIVPNKPYNYKLSFDISQIY